MLLFHLTLHSGSMTYGILESPPPFTPFSPPLSFLSNYCFMNSLRPTICKRNCDMFRIDHQPWPQQHRQCLRHRLFDHVSAIHLSKCSRAKPKSFLTFLANLLDHLPCLWLKLRLKTTRNDERSVCLYVCSMSATRWFS